MVFCCRAWFLLLIIEEGRGWKRIKRGGKRKKEEADGWKEEAGGGRRKQGRQRKIGKRGWLCALGAEHVAEQMVDGSDGAWAAMKKERSSAALLLHCFLMLGD